MLGKLKWAALAALLSGCTLGPDFLSPTPPAVNGYAAPGEAVTVDAGPESPKQTIVLGQQVAADWWKAFRSAPLDALVKQVVAGNHTLESAKARLLQAHEAIAASSSALYPQIGANAGITRESLSATAFGLQPSAFPLPPNFNLYQVGPTASYSLDLFGGTRREVERQTALAERQRLQLDAAYMSLTGNAVAQAVQIASVRAQTKAIGGILEIDRQNLGLVDKERQAGSVPDSDVVVAQAQLAADETLQPPLDQQASVAQHALAALVGRLPAQWAPPDFDLDALTLPAELPVSLPSELVHRRPDIMAAEADLHAASAQIGVATADLYPKITLSASAGLDALDPGHLFNPEAVVWSIAAGLTQPVFDGGLREAERKSALDAFKASAADYQQVVVQAFAQVADILQALRHDAQLVAEQRRAVDLASESVRLQRIAYTRGGAGVLNLLDAQRQYQRAALGYVQAQAQRYQDTVQLFVAMGGGWQGDPIAAAAE
jgi:NodT family efflux transporter outer membrane factor (OMF) lipoprotein